jgi:hypothetical protein
MPLPREETTPPVTKMNLAIRDPSLGHLDQVLDAREIFRRIDTKRLVIGLDHPNPEAVFERSQLFQTFRLFQRAHRQRRIT